MEQFTSPENGRDQYLAYHRDLLREVIQVLESNGAIDPTQIIEKLSHTNNAENSFFEGNKLPHESETINELMGALESRDSKMTSLSLMFARSALRETERELKNKENQAV